MEFGDQQKLSWDAAEFGGGWTGDHQSVQVASLCRSHCDFTLQAAVDLVLPGLESVHRKVAEAYDAQNGHCVHVHPIFQLHFNVVDSYVFGQLVSICNYYALRTSRRGL